MHINQNKFLYYLFITFLWFLTWTTTTTKKENYKNINFCTFSIEINFYELKNQQVFGQCNWNFWMFFLMHPSVVEQTKWKRWKHYKNTTTNLKLYTSINKNYYFIHTKQIEDVATDDDDADADSVVASDRCWYLCCTHCATKKQNNPQIF